MSLFGSLFAGVSGLSAQSKALAVISDNVANVSTVGYKGGISNFATLVTNPNSASAYTPGGVRQSAQFLIDKQGLVQASSSATDAAIVGNGFFVVSGSADSEQKLYTRAGSFTPDKSGFLKSPTGFYLQGWKLDANENVVDVNRTEAVNVRDLNATTSPTTKLKLGAHLDSGEAIHTGAYAAGNLALYESSGGTSGVEPDFKRQVELYDSLGNAHTVTVAFLRTTGASTWSVEVYADPAEVETGAHPNGMLASGTLTFNGDGSLDTAAITPNYPGGAAAGDPIGIDWLDTGGANDSTIRMDWGQPGQTDGVTQSAGESSVAFVTKDGAGYGELNSVSIDSSGFVVASFSNGQTKRIYQLPLATFPNSSALQPQSGNVFARTRESGEANLLTAGSGGSGTISASALEAANVDLADEFTKMIVTQRAYSANAKIITTADDMLDQLMNIKR